MTRDGHDRWENKVTASTKNRFENDANALSINIGPRERKRECVFHVVDAFFAPRSVDFSGNGFLREL